MTRGKRTCVCVCVCVSMSAFVSGFMPKLPHYLSACLLYSGFFYLAQWKLKRTGREGFVTQQQSSLRTAKIRLLLVIAIVWTTLNESLLGRHGSTCKSDFAVKYTRNVHVVLCSCTLAWLVKLFVPSIRWDISKSSDCMSTVPRFLPKLECSTRNVAGLKGCTLYTLHRKREGSNQLVLCSNAFANEYLRFTWHM